MKKPWWLIFDITWPCMLKKRKFIIRFFPKGVVWYSRGFGKTYFKPGIYRLHVMEFGIVDQVMFLQEI